MKRLALLILPMLFLVAPDFVRAHLFHTDGLVIVMYPADTNADIPGEERTVALHIVNGYHDPVTLNGITLDGYGPLEIETERNFFLFKTWRSVDELEIGPSEELAVAPPFYRIIVPAREWYREDFKVIADFGVYGKLDVFRPFTD